jgi:hypothetical protein
MSEDDKITVKQWEPIYCVIIMGDNMRFEGWMRPSIMIPDGVLIQPSVVYNPNGYSFFVHHEHIVSVFPALPPERDS